MAWDVGLAGGMPSPRAVGTEGRWMLWGDPPLSLSPRLGQRLWS